MVSFLLRLLDTRVSNFRYTSNWRKVGALKVSPATFVERNITSTVRSAAYFCNQLTGLTDNISNAAVFVTF